MIKSTQRISLLLLLFFAVSGYAQEENTAVTVYNNNTALIRDRRNIDIAKGTGEVKFSDVASLIEPTSVHFKSLTAPSSVVLLEQNYEYDLVGTARLLEKYIGKEITVTTKQARSFTGTLLSSSQGDAIIRRGSGEIEVVEGGAIETISFPTLPEGLIAKPTLVWLLENSKGAQHTVEVSYLTGGLNWHAEYVAVSRGNDTRLDIGGWVSIENNSGATYQNAKLKLIAGEVHMAEPEKRLSRGVMAEALAAAPQFEEKSFFEYHLYTLPRLTTIKDRQTKQLSLFATTETKSSKIYTYDGSRDNKDVRVNLEFKNSTQDGLGIPLPKGKVRVYKEDVDKSLEFIGEDWIEHTPRDEKVRLFLGNAFDIIGERSMQDRKDLSKRSREETWRIVLRNHKEESVQVTVIEHVYGDWEIRRSSYPYRKVDARTIEFDLPVQADGETTLEYVILYSWQL